MSKTALELAKAFGYLYFEEVELLRKYAQLSCKAGENGRVVMVNIGAGAGTSGLVLREACPRADIYTIDKSPGGPLGGMEGERNAFRDAGRRLPIQILADSSETGNSWPKGRSCDLVFVDGDHSYDGVIKDINAWRPHIRVGGYMIFHDYGARWPEVVRAVDEHMTDWERIRVDRTTIVFRNPGKETPDAKRKTQRKKPAKPE